MGILNVTPDSFSDGNKFFDRRSAIAHALNMEKDGADIIDIGGESSRPGAREIGVTEEIDRVIPVIRSIVKRLKIPVSIDTRKAEVAEAAISAGASIINDISGLRHDRRIAGIASGVGAGIILMHMRGTPLDMQRKPSYKDVVRDIIKSLKVSIEIARREGVDEEKIILDPGIGFGKSCEHNLSIINRLKEISVLKRPICIGTSRKSFIGKILDTKDPASRISGTIIANTIAIMNGASILRVHDVKKAVETVLLTGSVITEKAVPAW